LGPLFSSEALFFFFFLFLAFSPPCRKGLLGPFPVYTVHVWRTYMCLWAFDSGTVFFFFLRGDLIRSPFCVPIFLGFPPSTGCPPCQSPTPRPVQHVAIPMPLCRWRPSFSVFFFPAWFRPPGFFLSTDAVSSSSCSLGPNLFELFAPQAGFFVGALF